MKLIYYKLIIYKFILKRIYSYPNIGIKLLIITFKHVTLKFKIGSFRVRVQINLRSRHFMLESIWVSRVQINLNSDQSG